MNMYVAPKLITDAKTPGIPQFCGEVESNQVSRICQSLVTVELDTRSVAVPTVERCPL